MIYRLRIRATHRFNQLPIRTKIGKVPVTKEAWVDIPAEDLADGEAFTIRRYEAEGRFIVKLVRPKRKRRARAEPKAKVKVEPKVEVELEPEVELKPEVEPKVTPEG